MTTPNQVAPAEPIHELTAIESRTEWVTPTVSVLPVEGAELGNVVASNDAFNLFS